MLPYREITDEEFFSDCVFYAEDVEDLAAWGNNFEAITTIALDKNNRFRAKMVFQNLHESAAFSLYVLSIKCPEFGLESAYGTEHKLPFTSLYVHYSYYDGKEELILYLKTFVFNSEEKV